MYAGQLYFAVVHGARRQKEPPMLSHCGCAFSGDLNGLRSGIMGAQNSHRVSSEATAAPRVWTMSL